MVVLTVMHGQQLGWVCLGSCGTDVIVNALALYFVTGSVDEAASQSPPDHVASPPSKRHSGTATLRKVKAAKPPEDAPDVSYVSNKGILTSDTPSGIGSPQRTVHFPGPAHSDISEYEMTDKIDDTNPAQTTANFLIGNTGPGAKRGAEELKHHAYLGVNGMITRADTVGTSKIS